MDDFDTAHTVAQVAGNACLDLGVDPVVAADAFLTQALSLWAAETDNIALANVLIAAWVGVRDGVGG